MEDLRIVSKKTPKVPKGATIHEKNVNTRVEEIENGFLIIKSYEISYSLKGQRDWVHYDKKVFSKENPVEIKEPKMLADNFKD